MAGTSETPEDSPAGPDDINSRLAEIAAELAAEARFKEPSAAERARARVTAVRPGGQSGWRAGPLARLRAKRAERRAAQLRTPLRSAGAPPPRPAPSRPSLRDRRAARMAVPDRGYADAEMPSRLRSGTTIVIIMVLLIGVSVGLRYLIRHYASAPARPTPSPSTGHASTGHSSSPTVSPTITITAAAGFNPADPFARSPAAGFADGARGIVAPAGHKTGQFSAAEVSAAYATTRQLLIAGHLDPTTLAGGSPAAFADLLASSERSWFLAHLNQTGMLPDGDQSSSRAWVTSFAPGTTQLVGTVIKVHGQMSASPERDGGQSVLRVHTDYLFVYPVASTANLSEGMRVVTRVWMNVDFAQWNAPASHRLVPDVTRISGSVAGGQCNPSRGFVYPAFGGSPSPSVSPAGPAVNPYDQSKPPAATGACLPAAGT
jgi:hypothetical protein